MLCRVWVVRTSFRIGWCLVVVMIAHCHVVSLVLGRDAALWVRSMAASSGGGGRCVRKSSGVAPGSFAGDSQAWTRVEGLLGTRGCSRRTGKFGSNGIVAAVYFGCKRSCVAWRLDARVQEEPGKCSCHCSACSYMMEVLVRPKGLSGAGTGLGTGLLLNPRSLDVRWYCFGGLAEQERAEGDAAGSLIEGSSPDLAVIGDETR